MSSETLALIEKMQKGKKYQRMSDTFANFPPYNLPIKVLEQEIETMHKMRPMRTLKFSGGGYVERLIEACMADQAIRSRLSEISLQSFRAEKSLTIAIDALRDFLITYYSAHLYRFKTKEERLRIIDCVLVEFNKYIADVNRLQKMTAIVINDIDQSAWTVKAIIEALKLSGKNEVTL